VSGVKRPGLPRVFSSFQQVIDPLGGADELALQDADQVAAAAAALSSLDPPPASAPASASASPAVGSAPLRTSPALRPPPGAAAIPEERFVLNTSTGEGEIAAGVPPSASGVERGQLTAFWTPAARARDNGNIAMRRVPSHEFNSFYRLASSDGRELYFLGVIDIFTRYSNRKRTEHFLKSLIADGAGISAVDPKTYALRFVAFISSLTE